MSDNPDIEFLISCLLHADSVTDWNPVAEENAIAGTAALKPSTLAQRKFKKIVEASGKYKLEKGKITLKDGNSGKDDDGMTPATPAKKTTDTAPATPGTGKKRGRPAKAKTSTTPAKKVKKVPTPENSDEDVEEDVVRKEIKADEDDAGDDIDGDEE